jgi:hypothetical protein|tara:strand:- start:15729 stop:16046 length:318 start_codon:yes stop_codon:yes gene_type:complete
MFTTILQDRLSETVTVRSITNDEFIGKLIAIEDDCITIQNPRTVLINGPDVVLGPFVLTAKADIVTMQLSNILCVLQTLENTNADYEAMLTAEQEAEQDVEETIT